MVLIVPAAAQAAAFGIGMLFNGYYGFAVWGIFSLVTLAVLATVLLSAPLEITRPAVVAVSALIALTVWSGLSALWAQSEDAVWTETNRLVYYTATLALLLLCIRTARGARAVVVVLAAASAISVVYVTARLFSDDAPTMFPQFRLTEPLGYVNGMAGALMMTVWIFIGFVHWTRMPSPVAGLAVGFATLSGCLLVLTQSRAVVPAILISAVVVFLLVPDRVRRAWALVIVGCGVGVALPHLLDVYQQIGSRAVSSADVIHRAALWSVAVACGTGLVWAIVASVAPMVSSRPARTASAAIVASIPVLGVVAVLGVIGNPVDWTKRQVDTFTALKAKPPPTNTRYASVSGYRYDVWRVAWGAFKDNPVRGLGAGNYPAVFAARRRSPQYVRQPHSIELQALSELGLVGGALLLGFVGAVFWPGATRRTSTVARGDTGLLTISVGLVSVWLAHTSVDWLYNLPALTGMALVGAAILLARPHDQPAAAALPPRRGGRGVRRRLLASGALVLVVLAAASVGRALAGTVYLGLARENLANDPRRALTEARRSLQVNPESVAAYYASAAASARLGDYPRAKASLLEATRREPFNYVPWALLGDLETRRGETTAARAAYGRASSLSPYDPDLRRLVSLPPFRATPGAPRGS